MSGPSGRSPFVGRGRSSSTSNNSNSNSNSNSTIGVNDVLDRRESPMVRMSYGVGYDEGGGQHVSSAVPYHRSGFVSSSSRPIRSRNRRSSLEEMGIRTTPLTATSVGGGSTLSPPYNSNTMMPTAGSAGGGGGGGASFNMLHPPPRFQHLPNVHTAPQPSSVGADMSTPALPRERQYAASAGPTPAPNSSSNVSNSSSVPNPFHNSWQESFDGTSSHIRGEDDSLVHSLTDVSSRPSSLFHPPSTSGETTPTHKPQQQQQQQQQHDHTENEDVVTQNLRSLVVSSLQDAPPMTTLEPSSSSMFYASTLYARTNSPRDAHLYAKALASNGQRKRAVALLDKAGLLYLPTNFMQHHHSSQLSSKQDNNRQQLPSQTTSSQRTHIHNMALLRIHSILLAAQCLSSLGEWEDALSLMEHVTTYPMPCLIIANKTTTTTATSNELGAANFSLFPPSDQIDHYNPAIYSASPTTIPDSIIDWGDDPRLFLLANALATHSSDIHPLAQLCALRGMAYDELGNPFRAASFLRAAIIIDSKCTSALQYLSNRKLLSSLEEQDLLMQVTFQKGFEWLRDIYIARLSGIASVMASPAQSNHLHSLPTEGTAPQKKQYSAVSTPHKNSEPIDMIDESPIPMASSTPMIIHSTTKSAKTTHATAPARPDDEEDILFQDDEEYANQKMPPATQSTSSKGSVGPSTKLGVGGGTTIEEAFSNLRVVHNLSRSPEILSLAAKRAYENYDLRVATTFCDALHDIDPLCTDAGYIHISSLTGLRQKRPLFRLAHAFVNANPKSGLAWYAVGCYYYACQKYDLAQRHLCRATRLDPRSAECWIAFGCAFASCDESDQALASYRAAQRLHSGSHYPMLYMGMEYLRTNHLSLAGHFLRSSRSMGPDDPLCCNEMGVWCYRKGDYVEAAVWFVAALRLRVDIIALSTLSGSSLALFLDDKETKDNGGHAQPEHLDRDQPKKQQEEDFWPEDEVGKNSTIDQGGVIADRLGDEKTADEFESTLEGDPKKHDPNRKTPMSSVRFAKNNTFITEGIHEQQPQQGSPEVDNLSSSMLENEGRSNSSSSVHQVKEAKNHETSTDSTRHDDGARRHPSSFLTDMECMERCQDEFWEPTIFNLGQCYRKMRRFHEATCCFEKCLSLSPGNASSFAALGFTRHLVGDLDGAIESYHHALGRKPDDPFSTEMLTRALNEVLDAPPGNSENNLHFISHDESYAASFDGNGGTRTKMQSRNAGKSTAAASMRSPPQFSNDSSSPANSAYFSNVYASPPSSSGTPPVRRMMMTMRSAGSSFVERHGQMQQQQQHQQRGQGDVSGMAVSMIDDSSHFTVDSGDVDMSTT